LEVSRLKIPFEQLRDAVALIYSLLVMATIIPGHTLLPHLLVLPYFLFVPGYFVTLLFGKTGSLLERLFYALAWSVAIFLSAYSVETVLPGNQLLPIELVIPALTITLLAYDRLRKPHGA
jgi:uncharacterized membrane protein